MAETTNIDIELNPEFSDQIVDPEQQFQKFRPIDISQQDVLNFAEYYADPDTVKQFGSADTALAESVLRAASVNYNIPNLTLESVKRGDSGFQKFLEKEGISTMFGKSIYPKTDRDVLDLFSTVDVANNPLIEGLLEQGPESLGFSGGFFLGSKTFFTKAPPTMGVRGRIFGALGAGFTTGLITSGIANYADDLLFGPEIIVPPSERPYYEGGKALADFLSFMPLPYLVKPGAKLGAVHLVENIRRRADLIENSGITFTADKSKFLKDLQAFQKRGKVPFTLRLSKGIDTLFASSIKPFQTNPIRSGITELGAGSGAAFARIISEQENPGEFFPAFGSEVAGGVGAGLVTSIGTNLIVYPSYRILAGALPIIKNIFTKFRLSDKPTGEAASDFFTGKTGPGKVFRTFRERTAVKDLIEKIEIFGEDPNQIIAKLEADYETPEAYANSNIKIAYDKLSELAETSAAFKADSPVLMLIESTLANKYDHLSSMKKQQLMDAQKGLIDLLTILKGSGDDEALLVAGQIEDELLKDNIQTNLDYGIGEILTAFNKLRGSVAKDENTTQVLSRRLFSFIDESMDKARTKERELYENIPNFSISILNDENSNFLTAMKDKDIIPQNPTGKNIIYKKFEKNTGVFGFEKRVRKALGLETDDTIVATPSTTDKRLLQLQEQAANFSADTKSKYKELLDNIEDPIEVARILEIGDIKKIAQLEDKLGGIVVAFDKTISGKNVNRLSNHLEFIYDQVGIPREGAEGGEETTALLRKALAYLKGRPPTKTDKKGLSREDASRRTKQENEDERLHKEAIKYIETEIDISLLNEGRGADYTFNPNISNAENLQNLTEVLMRQTLDSKDKAGRDKARTLNLYAKKLIEIQNRTDIVDQSSARTLDTGAGLDEEPPLTLDELRDMRTFLYNEARVLKKAGDFDGHRRLNYLADALRKDILSLVDDPNAAEFADQLNAANKYSKALNDVFTRTAIGQKVFKTNRTGELTTPPELLYTELQGFNDAAALRYKEIENVHTFLKDEGLLKDNEEWTSTPTYQTVLYGLLRNDPRITGLFSEKNIRKNIDDPSSEISIPRINETTAKKLLNDPKAQEILNAFPAIRNDLQNSITKENLFRGLLDENSVMIKRAKDKHAFASLHNFESPEKLIALNLNSDEPIKNLNNLIADIKNFGKKIIKDPLDKDSATVTGATGEVPVNKFTKVVTTSDGVQRELIEEVNVSSMLRGLRESILGHVLTKSGLESTGPFNPAKAYEMLFQPIKGVGGRRRQSLATWMRSNKLITDTELKTFEKVLGNMQKIQSQQASGEIDVSTAENAFFQFTTRVAGATAGQTFQRFMFPNTAAGGLIAESSGSKLFQKFLLAIPEAARQDTMLEVMKDPTYLAQLMRDVRDEKVALSVIDFMKRKLKEASIIAVTGSVRRTAPAAKEEDLTDIIKEDQRDRDIDKSASVDLPQAGSPTTQVASRLNRGMKTPIAANVGKPPPAASIDRNRFASLFPNDPISGLINTQQQGTTQFMQYGGMAGDPSYDMGLETAPVSVQESIQSSLNEGVNLGGSDDNVQVQPKVNLPSTFTLNQNDKRSGIMNVANPYLQQMFDFVSKYKPSINVPESGGIRIGGVIPFQDGGFVDAGGGGDEDDYVSDAYSQSDFNQFGGQDNIDFGNYADETSAMQTAQGIVNLAGQTRSNIRDSVNYDPIYAQALNITRGLLPGNDVRGVIRGGKNFEDAQYNTYRGIENLIRPPSLTPQIPGDLDMRAGYGYERPMFFSGTEKFLVQDAPGLVRQAMDMGIMGLVRKAGDYFSSNFSKLFGGEATPDEVKSKDLNFADKKTAPLNIIGNPNYSINMRLQAGESLSDIIRSLRN